MDQVAIISDVHGNIVALEAALADIKRRGIDVIYNLGDVAGKGAHGDVTVDLCREVCDVVVRGNWDSFLQRPQDKPAFQWWKDQLGASRLDYLAHLPNMFDFIMSGRRIRLVHASNISEYHRIPAFLSYDVYLDLLTNTEFTGLQSPIPDVLGYGDIHQILLYSLSRHQKMVFNPGSVGNPLDEPTASYVVLHGAMDNETRSDFIVESVRLNYDIEKAVQVAEAANMPEVEVWADELRTGVYREIRAEEREREGSRRRKSKA